MNDEHIHRNCFSSSWMREGYQRSPDFEICNADGMFNPIGGYYKSLRTGRIKKLYGACEFEYLPNGDRNSQWTGCPIMDKVPSDDVDVLDRLLGGANDR